MLSMISTTRVEGAFCLRRSFAKDVVPQVNDMIKFARDENIPIIYTLHGAVIMRTSTSGLTRWVRAMVKQ